jgi:sugar transferase (PEP-CTERM/EpsH1 system associated)
MNQLLFLAHRIPYPPIKGDKLRSYHLLKQLGRYYRIHLGCFIDDPNDWRYVEEVRDMCSDAFFLPLRAAVGRIRSLAGLLGEDPLSLGYYRDQRMVRWVRSAVDRCGVDRALVFSSVMAQYVEDCKELNRVADFVDVDSCKWEQYANDVRWPASWIYRREAKTLLAYERKVAECFDATVFVSKAEADLFRGLVTKGTAEKIWHAGNGVDSEYFDPGIASDSPFEPEARTLVFTGAMDYKPNIDAVDWFAREIFPGILRRWPDARLAIVGSRPNAVVRKLRERPRVAVTGTVPDVRPYLAHATAVVAPLRIARGIQNKVLEGMAMARTVIASTAAAEGIEAEPGQDIVLADTLDEYLAAVSAVFEDTSNAIGRNARKRILASYSWSSNLERIQHLLERKDAMPSRPYEYAATAA